MNCQHCGHDIPTHARFCIKCGQAQIPSPPAQQTIKYPTTRLTKVPSPLPPLSVNNSSNRKKGCGCIAIFFACIFAVSVIGSINGAYQQSESLQDTGTEQQTEVTKINSSKNVNTNYEKTPNTKKTTQTTEETKVSEKPHKAIILDGAVSPIPTQKGKGFDKTIARYGVQRIKKINKLLPKVAEKAATAKYMDIIWNVDVSDNYSTASELIFYADAKNGNRVYISEDLRILDARKMY